MNPLPIMVVDDDPGTRETLTDILTDWHYQPIVFESGNEALEAYAQNPVGVILTDIRLSDLSGLRVLQAAREINPDVAVVVMSDHASVENAIQALNQGASAYIVKPLNMDELRAILRKAFREVRLSQENKRLIDNLQMMNRKLEKAGQELETKNQNLVNLTEEMEGLLHIVSHDLKSPLINIHGFSSLLEEQLLSLRGKCMELLPQVEAGSRNKYEKCLAECEKAQLKSFPFIKKGVQKMDQMIQNLLHLSRIGHTTDPYEWNDLNEMIADMRDLFSYQFKQEGIEFHADPLPKVWCRKNEINQVFSNLIVNAINYMGDKPEKKISIRSLQKGDHFLFSVRDTGIGIREEDKEKIFAVFSRLREVAGEGEGIGLTLVKKIIRGHGGRIWVESRKGKGSVFYFTLPRGKGGNHEPSSQPEST